MNTTTERGAPAVSVSSQYGAVGKLDDGRSYVHFERHLAHSIDKVWAALTDPEQLATWFPGINLERRAGGHFEIWFGGECDGPAHVSGTVTRFEPPRVLECGSFRWELTPETTGCKLEFTDILNFSGPRSRTDITNAVLGGWHRYLDTLEDALAGRAVDHEAPEPDYAKIDVPDREGR
jgi:uncharacterized protein YndB with AHSA1/START domain